jgi:hypothetical protein
MLVYVGLLSSALPTKATRILLHILKDVVDEMKLSIHLSCHPSIDGITAAHVVKILLYEQKQLHYTAVFFFFVSS